MKTNRLIAGGVALALVAALGGLAAVAGRDRGGDPAVLPILGTGGGGAAPERMASDMTVGGPVEYRAGGPLPALDDEAHAWELPGGEAALDRVTRLAAVLGVEGEPRRTELGWSVGTDARRLDVQDTAGNPWSLYRTVVEAGVARPDSAVSSAPDCAADDCDEPMMPTRPEDLPAKTEAERLGRQLLTDLGVDLDRAVVRVDDGVTVWNVNAEPVVDGLPTLGLATSVGIGSAGAVQYANGWLGQPTRGDRYPLIGVAAGLELLGADQVGIMAIEPAPEPGAGPEPVIVEVTDVHLGLQLFSTFEPGADGHLVPSYVFSTAEGGELPVVAVADEHLGEAPHHDEHEPGTRGEPEPGPSAPGGYETCESADGEGVTGTVCATSAAPGEPVLLRVTAAGTLRDDCGSPTVDFGDGGEGMATCAIGCESLPSEPVELERTFEHVYAAAGAYDVVVHFHGCGAGSGTDQLTVPILVRVEG